ncbi:MAG: heme-copper oxidase subunit III [Niabella sp.]
MRRNEADSGAEAGTIKNILEVEIVENQQHKRIHPYKFTLWVAMASMVMMFAGLTSAFIVKSNLTGWRTIVLPRIFWVSTVVILISSFTIQMAVRAARNQEMGRYRTLLLVTALLGAAFVAMQIVGFTELWAHNIRFKGSSGAGQFFYAITGLHGLHVLGGIVALIVMAVRAFMGRAKNSAASVEVIATYWHFVDVLWLYLIVFFLIVG